MKTLYLIGGTMGVGKTAVCQNLKRKLSNSVFLDGDWCWDAHPFQVTPETKQMVLENICFLLNQFIRCSAYENILFCWVMHEQRIVQAIQTGVDQKNCLLKVISLVCSPDTLRTRLTKDVRNGLRTPDIIERSIQRLPLYAGLDSIKVDTDHRTVDEVADAILAL